MPEAKVNDTVRIHYTGSLDDGTTFDSSKGNDPLEFTLGAGQVIPGFENAVEGMSVGETKSVHIPKEQAYGERREDLILNVDHNQFPEGVTPQVGQQFELRTQSGKAIPAMVARVSDDSITLDANHPLAGQDLNFELELVEIV